MTDYCPYMLKIPNTIQVLEQILTRQGYFNFQLRLQFLLKRQIHFKFLLLIDHMILQRNTKTNYNQLVKFPHPAFYFLCSGLILNSIFTFEFILFVHFETLHKIKSYSRLVAFKTKSLMILLHILLPLKTHKQHYKMNSID